MTESLNGWGTGITSDDNKLLFELLSLLLNHQLSRGVFCDDLDDCWWNEGNWGGLMNELLNGVVTGITSDKNEFLF